MRLPLAIYFFGQIGTFTWLTESARGAGIRYWGLAGVFNL